MQKLFNSALSCTGTGTGRVSCVLGYAKPTAAVQRTIQLQTQQQNTFLHVHCVVVVVVAAAVAVVRTVLQFPCAGDFG